MNRLFGIPLPVPRFRVNGHHELVSTYPVLDALRKNQLLVLFYGSLLSRMGKLFRLATEVAIFLSSLGIQDQTVLLPGIFYRRERGGR